MRAALAFISVVVLALHAYVFNNQFFARWQDHQKKYFKEAAADLHERRRQGDARRAPARDRADDRPQLRLRARRPLPDVPHRRRRPALHEGRPAAAHAPAGPRPPLRDVRLHDLPRRAGPRGRRRAGATAARSGRGRSSRRRSSRPTASSATRERVAGRAARERGPPPLLRARLLHLPHDRGPLLRLDRPRALRGRPPPPLGVRRRRRSRTRAGTTRPPRCRGRTSTKEQRTAARRVPEGPAGRERLARAAREVPAPPRPSARSGCRSGSSSAATPRSPLASPGARPARRGAPPARRLPRPATSSATRDGRVGPELAFTSAQRDETWMLAHFRDPKSVVPGSLMPPYPLPDDIFESLSAYLLSRRVPDDPGRPEKRYARALLALPRREGAGQRPHRRATSTRSRATSRRRRSCGRRRASASSRAS